MSPRVKPKTRAYADHLDEQERLADAAHEFKQGKDELLEQVTRKHDLPRVSSRDRSVYGVDSPHSFFRDLAASAAEDQHREWMPHPQHGGIGEARARLATVEQRTLSTTATAGGNFVPPGPSYIGEAFATAARAASVMTTILPRNPLPEKGIFSLTTPRLTTGTTVAVQATQNTTISNTDFVESDVPNPVATIAGYEDLSQQLLDHSQPGMDLVLAADLGRAYGALTDQQIFRGIGSANQMLGLAAVSGITTDLYSDVSATQTEAFPVVCKLYADVATALGNTPDTIVMHPRRMAWFTNWKDSATGMQSSLKWPCAAYQVPAVSTTDGGSTNADEIYVLRSDELPIYMVDPAFRVNFDQAGSSTLTVRFTAYGYVSALFSRRPEAIGRSTGTGWSAPVFS